MNNYSSSDDQRHFRRIPFDASVRIEAGGGQYQGELLDLSLKGALVRAESGHQVVAGEAATVHIRLNDELGIDMKTTVAHVQDRRIGFRCDHIDVDSITHLARIVELNTGDPELLHRELSALIAPDHQD